MMCLLAVGPGLGGCATRPGGGNISYVKSHEELDAFVGQDVLYCAKALPGDPPSATNGKLIIAIEGAGQCRSL